MEILTKFISLLFLLYIGIVTLFFLPFFFFISLLARPYRSTVLFFETEPALVKFELCKWQKHESKAKGGKLNTIQPAQTLANKQQKSNKTEK